jgi:hypothetical protein
MGTGKCMYCGAEIVWMQTRSGKNIAVDIETCNQDDTLYDKETMKCHFDTCTNKGQRPISNAGSEVIDKLDEILVVLDAIVAKLEEKA